MSIPRSAATHQPPAPFPDIGNENRPPRRPPGRKQRRARKPRDVARAALFALPPTAAVLAMTALVQLRAHERLVFAPLAASAFLISHSPFERSNNLGVVVASQLVGAAAGIGVSTLVHGYTAEALAMIATISVLVAFDWNHAPAVPTALIFADGPTAPGRAGFFVAALCILAGLSVAQRALYRAFRRRD